MSKKNIVQNEEVFSRIKVMSNRLRFRILEITKEEEFSISELASSLKLSYTKCADYVRMLENLNLVTKTKFGKEVKVKSNVKIYPNKLILS